MSNFLPSTTGGSKWQRQTHKRNIEAIFIREGNNKPATYVALSKKENLEERFEPVFHSEARKRAHVDSRSKS